MSTVTMSEEFAQQYQEYRELQESISELTESAAPTVLASYRRTAVDTPQAMDAATLALALSGEVRFRKRGAASAALRALGGEDIPFDALRSELEVKESARAIIAACSQACAPVLVQAVAILFAEAHPSLVEFPEAASLPSEDDGADDAGDVDAPPPGYGGDE